MPKRKMINRTYVFSAALAGVALAGMPMATHRASAALLTNADFTFETSSSSFGTSVSSATIGPLVAEVGTGSAYGVHAGASTVYSSPTGNGSSHSLSSNDWAMGDYYQFTVPTTGIQNIVFSFDQIGSNSGPADFQIQYSVDGSTYSSAANYTAVLTGGTATFWSAGTSQSAFNYSFNLAAFTGLNNDANAAFRIVMNGTGSLNPTSTFGTGGTDRVDNVIIAGSATPEPASVSLVTVAAAAGTMRRRRRA